MSVAPPCRHKAWCACFSLALVLALTAAALLAQADDIDQFGNALSPNQKPAAASAGQPPANLPQEAPLEDVTDKLVLRPGVSIAFPIYRGIDTHWKKIGDYEFKVHVLKYGDEGLLFDWTMSEPADAEGSRGVNAEDLKDSYKVSLFYPKRESCTIGGFTNAVRVSDAMYRSLKEGKKTDLELDGPDVPPGSTRDPRYSPHSMQPQGVETVPVIVNERRVKVRAIKATADNGWSYWIMDNPGFPAMVKGDGPFSWSEPRFDTTVADANDVIKQLEEKGEATTYAILFDFNKANIKNPSKPILDGLGKYLTDRADIRLEVQGHTDNIGTMQYNIKLSQRRAQAVKDYLVKRCAVRSDRLKPLGFGFKKPIASNLTANGRALNRRVVFKKYQ